MENLIKRLVLLALASLLSSGCLGSSLSKKIAVDGVVVSGPENSKTSSSDEPPTVPTNTESNAGNPGSSSSGGEQSGSENQGNQPVTSEPENTNAVWLAGEVTALDGSVIQLSQFKSKNVVLVFSAPYCDVCMKESSEIMKSLREASLLPDFKLVPTNAVLMSVVTVAGGATIEDVDDWLPGNPVDWRVTYGAKNDLFLKHCSPEKKTPCTVIQTEKAGIVYQAVGLVGPETIQSKVGKWRFN